MSTFSTWVAGYDRCHAWVGQCLLNLERLPVLSAGRVFYNSIQILTTTTDFVGFSFYFTGYDVWLVPRVLSALSLTGNLITMLRVKRDFFLQNHFECFCLTSSVYIIHIASNSLVSKVSKIVLWCQKRDRRKMNIFVFFGKRSIVIKLPVSPVSVQFCKVLSHFLR